MCTSSKLPKATKLAATAEHGLSPNLIRAHADHPHSTFAAWSLIILCTASFYIGPLLLLAPFMLYPFVHPQTAGMLFCTSIFLAFHPVSPWPKFRRYCQMFYKVFNFHHNMTPALDEIAARENRLSIVACHPHAIIPLHGFIWAALCDQMLPHMYGYGCTTDGALVLPVLRHLLRYLGVGTAKRNEILTEMQTRDQNTFILPGGVAEIFLSHRREHQQQQNQPYDKPLPNTQTIKAKRYGLMKLALETGAVIYPVFVFGASDMLDQLTPVEKKGGSRSSNSKDDGKVTIRNFVGNMMETLSRKVQGGLTLFYGQYYLPIPHAPQLSMVCGNPIYPVEENENRNDTSMSSTMMKNVNGSKMTCRRVENPTTEQVEDLMERYVDALERLFEQYKEEAGYPNETLEII